MPAHRGNLPGESNEVDARWEPATDGARQLKRKGRGTSILDVKRVLKTEGSDPALPRSQTPHPIVVHISLENQLNKMLGIKGKSVCWLLSTIEQPNHVAKLAILSNEPVGSGQSSSTNHLAKLLVNNQECRVLGCVYFRKCGQPTIPSMSEVLQQWKTCQTHSHDCIIALCWEKGHAPAPGLAAWRIRPEWAITFSQQHGIFDCDSCDATDCLEFVPLTRSAEIAQTTIFMSPGASRGSHGGRSPRIPMPI